jgi:hypothetical protein
VTDAANSQLGSEMSELDVEFSIQQASLLLNVPAPTLRSWERRYGSPWPTAVSAVIGVTDPFT